MSVLASKRYSTKTLTPKAAFEHVKIILPCVLLTLSRWKKPIVMVDLYRSYRDSQLVGMSGYSKERMASDMKKRMLDLNRWPIRCSKGIQFQLAMTYVDTNLGRGWYNSWSRDGAMEGK